jgi:hypothetical protein
LCGFFLRIEDGTEYLITAKHLVVAEKVDSQAKEPEKIGIYHDGTFKYYAVERIRYFEGAEYKDEKGEDLYDAAVVRLKTLPPFNFFEPPFDIGYGHFFRSGQDFYFMGFPDKCPIIPVKRGETTWPAPFIKKGCYSMIFSEDVFIDAINCAGFSGGPIIYYNEQRCQPAFGGVISGYIQHEAETSKPKTLYWMNTGITRATSIDKVIDIIKQFDSECPIVTNKQKYPIIIR